MIGYSSIHRYRGHHTKTAWMISAFILITEWLDATQSNAETLGNWSPCSSSSECTKGCCSSMYSEDIFKCTPLLAGFDPVANGCVIDSTTPSPTTESISNPTNAPATSPVLTPSNPTKAPVQSPPTRKSTNLFIDSKPIVLCDYSLATAGSSVNFCTGFPDTVMNKYLNFNSFSIQNGYLSVNPLDSGASFFLSFGGGCIDGRGYNSLALDVMAPIVNTTIIVDIRSSSSSTGCSSNSSSLYSSTYTITQSFDFQTMEVPMSEFSSMDLRKMFSIGFTVGTGNEVRVKNIRLTRKAFVTRTQSTLFEWVNGTRREFKFTSFNVPDMIGRNDKGQDAYLDPWEQEDLFISAQQVNARAVRTYTLRVRSSNEISNGSGKSKAVQGSRSYSETQFVQLDRALDYASTHGIRVIIPFIDNWWWYGGVADFAAYRGLTHNDFFFDGNLKADFKALINKVLTRVNTINGQLYKDDPSILAWQLGNELCLNKDSGRDGIPVAWSSEISNYIRSLDWNHLIMDGSW